VLAWEGVAFWFSQYGGSHPSVLAVGVWVRNDEGCAPAVAREAVAVDESRVGMFGVVEEEGVARYLVRVVLRGMPAGSVPADGELA
jgi:hypothetical protein